MPRAAPLQSNFNGGELSPLIGARPSLDQYKTGLETCLNWLPLVQGPLTVRPGTNYVFPVKIENNLTRLQRFEFSVTQPYVLEFGDFYMRVFRNHAQVQATGVAAWSGATTYALGNMVTYSGLTYISLQAGNLNHQPDTSPTWWKQQNAYEIALPYASADVMPLSFAQSADTLYVAHPSYPPQKIQRTADNAWTLTQIAFVDGPYLNKNTTATTLTPSATSGNINITASSVNGINNGAGFQSADIGRLVRIKNGAGAGTWGNATITGITSTTIATATVNSAFGGTSATATWRLGVWSPRDGYPGTVTFYQDRLWWGGNTNYPQRLDSSNTGDYENMAPTAADDSVTSSMAVGVTLNANDVNVIRWLASNERGMLIGTSGGEWLMKATSAGDAITPTNVTAIRSTFYGSANVAPVTVGRATLFVQRSARKLRELAYLYIEDGFKAPDMTLLAEHITLGGIKQLAYQQEPQGIVWAVRGDGILLAFTYNRDQQVMGWSWHKSGGFSDPAQTFPAQVESIACIPAPDGTRDELWMVVNRYINGQTHRYVEYMSKIWGKGDTLIASNNVDAALSYSGAPATVFTGLTHLIGQPVSVSADGVPISGLTVNASGQVTLPNAASVVQIGLGYVADGRTLRPEVGAADGTAVGKTKRINRVDFRLVDTVGLQAGPDIANLDPMQFRTTAVPAGQATPLFTGDKFATIESDYDFDGQISFRQDQPLPATIAAIAPQLVEQDNA